MTEKLYHPDAYLQEFEARVTMTMEGWVALDRTTFYLGDGGTHVGNSRDVGQIRVADSKSKGRINEHLVVELED